MNSLTALLFLIFATASVIAQNITYISPVPDSKLNSSETHIILKTDGLFDNSYLNKIIVTGNISGVHSGNAVLAEENKTLIFKPYNKFADGEIVTVELQTPNKLKFSFQTSEINYNEIVRKNPEKYFKKMFPEIFNAEKEIQLNKSHKTIFETKSYTIQKDTLPEDFPVFYVDSVKNPTQGNVFFTPFRFPGFLPTYLIITDHYGTPVFYRKMSANTYDFKKVTEDKLTYYDIGTNYYYLLDSTYNVIDSLAMIGYLTDLHELIIEDGHAFLMSYDYQYYPMDTVVQGGDPNAVVIGIVLQELDENKNLVFQWRSWDHYKITDATYDIDLTDSLVDYAHSNAIEIDYDGHILLSTRHFDEITKINRQTGEIIWRLGGEHCENNEFTFLNDPMGFSHQHDVRRLPNGNITMFDNGNLHSPSFSRSVEYQIDEVNKYATLVWEYRNDPSTYSGAMGSSRRLENHNTIIGWGTSFVPAISEVNAEGEVVFYLSFEDGLFNYRAFKYPWKTNLFVTNPDSLFFGYVPNGDSLTLTLEIKNNSNEEIEINGILNRDSSFYVNTNLPVLLPPLGTADLQVTFKPESDGNYNDELHLQWNKENERIAQVVKLIGTTVVSVDDDAVIKDYYLSQNYPNPFNPVTTFEFHLPSSSNVILKIYDILGNEIETVVNKEMKAGRHTIKYDGSKLSSGVYYYRLITDKYSETKKMILLK